LPVVILAAGEGRRLQARGADTPKPLTALLGRTLLERAILPCREVGLSEFYVVTGCHAEEMTPYVEELGRLFGISAWAIRNPSWKEGIGTSVLVASSHITGPFLLLMGDHLFDPRILHCLINAYDERSACFLAIDRHTDRVFDLKEATKVRLTNQCVTAIGKGIVPFDAIDAGLFLCQPLVFEALEKAIEAGSHSLSAGIRELIRQGHQVRGVDIGNLFWHDVDTPESLACAKQRLLAGLEKPGEDGYISRHLNRPLSVRFSTLLAHTPLTPNWITVLSCLIALCGAFFFSLGRYPWTVLAGLLIQLASVLDGCDGEIARLKFLSSRFGAWLDTVLDRYADVAIATAIAYGYWLSHPQPIVWLGGILTATGFILASYTQKEYALRYQQKPPNVSVSKLLTRDLRLFALFVGALLNRPFEAMILVGLLSHLGIGWTLLAVFRQRRQAL
jgi:CDP-L-myo-inositol myo-inositolphosphotransferase